MYEAASLFKNNETNLKLLPASCWCSDSAGTFLCQALHSQGPLGSFPVVLLPSPQSSPSAVVGLFQNWFRPPTLELSITICVLLHHSGCQQETLPG